MDIRVYIAAPYPMREVAVALWHRLEIDGIEVTSRWLKDADTLADEHAQKELTDVRRADILVALNPPEWVTQGTGGRHVELGYALAMQKPVLVIGPRSNIFHYLHSVVVVPSILDNLPAMLRAMMLKG